MVFKSSLNQNTSGGTVTSVGLSAPSDVFNVSGSPVTGSGTLALNKVTLGSPNLFYATVSTSGTSQPSFRTIVASDIASFAVTSVSNGNGTISIPVTTGAVTVSLNLSNANAWNANQSFAGGMAAYENTGSFVTIDSNAGLLESPIDGTPAIDWGNRILYANDGSTAIVNYSGAGANNSVNLSFDKTLNSFFAGSIYLHGTGGTSQVLKQSTLSGAITVGQLAFSDLSGSATAAQMPAFTGDVTTSAGSTVTTIAANAVTNAKLATMAANTVKTNATAGVAVPTDVALTASTFLGRGASGNIVACTLGATLAFSTAALQTVAHTGDVTTSANSFATTIAANAVSNAKFRQSGGLSVVGNATSSTANVADITGTADQVARVDSAGTTLGFGAINVASANAVTGLLSPANAGAGVIPSYTLKTDVTNATATPTNLTSFTITVTKSAVYFGTMTILANNSIGADGLAIDFGGGTATITSGFFGFDTTPVGSTLGTAVSTATGTPITLTAVSTSDIIYVIYFSFLIGVNGTIIPRFSENVHTTGTLTFRTNSSLFVVKSS